MNERVGAGVSSGAVRWILIVGLGIGVVYTLSPLTVLTALAAVVLVRWAGAGSADGERRWVYALLMTAIALRALALAALFATTNHAHTPFGFFFPDEELFVRRSIWMRNIALAIPVHSADFIYVYDEAGATSYLYPLALAHLLLGPSPYGVHLLSAVLYLAGCVVLFRLVRPAFGAQAAGLGFAALLFLPSLFLWSISVLKEPMFFMLMALGAALTVRIARTRSWLLLAGGVAVLIALVFVEQSIREGGLVMVGGGLGTGLLLAWLVQRPRLLVAMAIVGAVAAPIVLTRGTVQDRVVHSLREAAKLNWGHVNSRGYVYTTLSPRIYEDRDTANTMTLHEGARYVANSFVSYVAVPAPWQIQSRSALVFWPEQAMWYALVALVPVGLFVGLRRSPDLACVLAAAAATAIAAVALTSGNIGTLVRHRGLALPYLVWFSVLGWCTVLVHLSDRTRDHADH